MGYGEKKEKKTTNKKDMKKWQILRFLGLS